MTLEDVQRQIPALLRRVHLECLVYGNYVAREAADMCTRIEACISSAHGSGTLLPCEREHWRSFGLDCEDYECVQHARTHTHTQTHTHTHTRTHTHTHVDIGTLARSSNHEAL